MLSTLSSFTKILAAGALVASSTGGALAQSKTACQGANCVLPLAPAAPPPPVETASVPVEAVAPVEVEAKGLGILPLLLGAALAAVALYFLLDDDEEEEPASP